jgi:hypothetical protein
MRRKTEMKRNREDDMKSKGEMSLFFCCPFSPFSASLSSPKHLQSTHFTVTSSLLLTNSFQPAISKQEQPLKYTIFKLSPSTRDIIFPFLLMPLSLQQV